ncbi:zinc finger RNA-binding protein isoform X3 [Tetranychus urticae]|uniref:zinc finger RNA-binding protein isoform X3 n=1 Tax=Tetranychus urticae TaxID=32264 RepID=UPI00077B9F02|nr:zinc finger RNA-binding protein isoform X3 [Tetranychus urticae]
MTSNNYYGFAHGGNTYGSGYLSTPNVAQAGFGHGPVASSYTATQRASSYDQGFATTGATMAANYGYARPQVGHSRSFFQAPAAVAYTQDANQYSAANATTTMYPYTASSTSYTNTYNSVVTNYAASALYSQQSTVAQHDNTSTAAYPSNKQGNWNFKKTLKTNKMKTAPKVQQLHYCEVCKISCAGPQTYKEHLDGQRHKKKEAQMKTGAAITPNKRGQPVGVSLRCGLCDVTCTGNDAYAAHIRGSKHQKVLKLHTRLESNLMDQDKNDSQPVGQDYVEEIKSDDSKAVSFHCKLCDCRFNDPNAKEMHLKGRRHRLQYKKKVDPNLVVDIKPSLKQRKIQETKDRRYFHNKQRDHYWNDGWYPPPNRGGGVGVGVGGGGYGYDNRHMPPPPPPPHMMPLSGFSGPVGPGPMMGPAPFRGRSGHSGGSWDDNHLIQKHSEICPSESELDEIHHVVMVTERALAGVYDKLSKEDSQAAMNEVIKKEFREEISNLPGDQTTTSSESVTNNPMNQETAGTDENPENSKQLDDNLSYNKAEKTTNGQNSETNEKNDDVQSNRMLRGLMRIGPLAKNLLLSGDREVDLVIVCSDKPTVQLVQRVVEHLPKQLEEVNPSDKFEIQVKLAEAMISVMSTSEPQITVNVSFTSPSIRDNSVSDGAPAEMVKEPKQMLDRQKCLNALAALRHAKWYQARVANLHPCPMTIRLIRDLCRRLPTWSKLDLWAVELLCERVISSAGEQLNPGEAFRHVLEAIASGLLLPGGAGLMDPCEKEPTDALANLTRQEREDITSSAQHALRLIAFRQIHKILGVEPMQPRPRKRRLDSGTEESNAQEGDNDNKKDKKETTWTEEDGLSSVNDENSQKLPKTEPTNENSSDTTSTI